MMLSGNKQRDSKPKSKMKIGRLFKKDSSKKTVNAVRGSNAVVVPVTNSGRRGSKKRHQVIRQFVHDDTSKAQKHLLWKDHSDTTSEESKSQDDANELDCSGIFSPVRPTTKSVTFATELVTFTVEIESSWDIFPGPMVETDKHSRSKTKATLLHECRTITAAHMAGYDPTERLQAQPKQRQFLAHDELAQIRETKERLAKYRRKLLKKHQKARRQRTQTLTALADDAVQASKERQDRIISRYKLAAPNAIEHRRRRHVKFRLARDALKMFKVQQRQRLLQGIRQTAAQRQERKRKEQQRSPEGGPPHHHIRHQMKRIMVHQASMKALIRLQRNNLKVYEVTCQPVLYPWKAPNKSEEVEEQSDSEDCSDDESLDTNDLNYRRLEWAALSYLAAAKSRQFNKPKKIPTMSKGNRGTKEKRKATEIEV